MKQSLCVELGSEQHLTFPQDDDDDDEETSSGVMILTSVSLNYQSTMLAFGEPLLPWLLMAAHTSVETRPGGLKDRLQSTGTGSYRGPGLGQELPSRSNQGNGCCFDLGEGFWRSVVASGQVGASPGPSWKPAEGKRTGSFITMTRTSQVTRSGTPTLVPTETLGASAWRRRLVKAWDSRTEGLRQSELELEVSDPGVDQRFSKETQNHIWKSSERV